MMNNIYESYKPLLEDWKDNIEVVREHVEEFSDIEATQLAMLLENTKTELDVAEGRIMRGMINETTDVSMITTMKSNVFDIVTAIMPNLIANDIVSVQPLDRRTGQVFFLKFKYGNKKGAIPQGGDMIAPGVNYAGADYSGEKISGEIVAADGAAQDVDYTLPYAPIQPGTVVLTDGALVLVDDGKGKFVTTGTLFDGTAHTATPFNEINYVTGKVKVSVKATTGDVTAEWLYDLNSPNAIVNEVDVTVESQPVIARPRKLKSIYMFDTAYDLKMSFGLDMDTVIMKATSGEIGFEIDNEIMQDLLAIAGDSSSWNKLPVYKGMELKDHKLTIIDAINEASNSILTITKRYEGSWIIAGKDGATVIEGLGADHYKRLASGIVGGPHLAGVLEDKYKVYKNPNYADNVMLVGAKGEMFIEAGYIYAPYIPVFATQLMVDENLKGKRGFATVYAKKVVNPLMYHKITLVANTQLNPQA
jgi:hypothetical protein